MSKKKQKKDDSVLVATNRGNIVYGSVEIPEDEFKPENMFIRMDIFNSLKEKLRLAEEALVDIDESLHYAITVAVDPKLCGDAIKTAWSRSKKARAALEKIRGGK